jgi:hypothetical protein
MGFVRLEVRKMGVLNTGLKFLLRLRTWRRVETVDGHRAHGRFEFNTEEHYPPSFLRTHIWSRK